ncbi:MAG: DUF6457 domain-containing protein [Mycobacteriaceae bacterium]
MSDNKPAKKHKDSPEEMQSAHAWLAQVAGELGLPADVARTSVKEVLDLTSAVAHNRSRPAAPVTAFLIGLAAGQAASDGAGNVSEDNLSAAYLPRIRQITDLASDGISEPS